MDFGVDGFLDKFEKHFGELATKALLILIGLAIAAVCIGAIWQWLVSPLLIFFQTPLRLRVLLGVLTYALATALGMLVSKGLQLWLFGKGRSEARAALRRRTEGTDRLLEALESRDQAPVKQPEAPRKGSDQR
jgi:hypothetical protein